jgi:hypothetical protein
MQPTTLAQMTTGELLIEDRRLADTMEAHAYANELEWTALGRHYLQQRKAVRAELERRHEATAK